MLRLVNWPRLSPESMCVHVSGLYENYSQKLLSFGDSEVQ